jgi:hypothetical protein
MPALPRVKPYFRIICALVEICGRGGGPMPVTTRSAELRPVSIFPIFETAAFAVWGK